MHLNIDIDVFLPCYHHLIEDPTPYDIDFLYGGRDSGKTRHIAMQLVVECIAAPYFKCLIVRKFLNTVRESQFSVLKSVIDEWGLGSLFSVNETRLEITLKGTKKGFFGRGLDKPGKIKSFNNPSHCWVEEGNQIEQNDFTILQTSLRANNVRAKIWFSFNPECDGNYTDFWLYTEYFEAQQPNLSFTWTKKVDIPGHGTAEFTIRATHTTYLDNPYCPMSRKAVYEGYKTSRNNKYWYQTYTLGLWGFRRTGDNFWKCFEEDKHTRDVIIDMDSPIHVSLDNNVNPYIAAACWQINMQGRLIKQVHEIPCISPNNTAAKAAYQFIAWLDRIGHNGLIFVYGDTTAKKKSTEDDEGRSFFDKFTSVLTRAGKKWINRVGKSNPSVSISGDFINEIYENGYEGWRIEIATSCRKSIEDYTMVKEDPEGGILKKKETNKDTGVSFERYGHYSDNKRYFITQALPSQFQAYATKRSRYKAY